MEEEGFVGYDCLPPYDDSFLRIQNLDRYIRKSETADFSRKSLHKLRFYPVFAVQPFGSEVGVFCYQSLAEHSLCPKSGPRHECDLKCHSKCTYIKRIRNPELDLIVNDPFADPVTNGFKFVCRHTSQHPTSWNVSFFVFFFIFIIIVIFFFLAFI